MPRWVVPSGCYSLLSPAAAIGNFRLRGGGHAGLRNGTRNLVADVQALAAPRVEERSCGGQVNRNALATRRTNGGAAPPIRGHVDEQRLRRSIKVLLPPGKGLAARKMASPV